MKCQSLFSVKKKNIKLSSAKSVHRKIMDTFLAQKGISSGAISN